MNVSSAHIRKKVEDCVRRPTKTRALKFGSVVVSKGEIKKKVVSVGTKRPLWYTCEKHLLRNNTGCAHNQFVYENPIHCAELHVCPLSGAFPTCQYPKPYRDEHKEDHKQYRIGDIQEEIGDGVVCEAANAKLG